MRMGTTTTCFVPAVCISVFPEPWFESDVVHPQNKMSPSNAGEIIRGLMAPMFMVFERWKNDSPAASEPPQTRAKRSSSMSAGVGASNRSGY
jgi:hypothetical protein